MRHRLDTPWALALPLAVAAFAHAPALAGGFTNWDDPTYLLNNPLTVDPLAGGPGELLATPKLGYPIPVTVLAFAAQRAAFGLDPAGFHAVSLALHLIVVALAAALCRRFGARWPGAAVAAAVLAAHPVTVEPVAWVVGQKDLLAAALTLAALLVYTRGALVAAAGGVAAVGSDPGSGAAHGAGPARDAHAPAVAPAGWRDVVTAVLVGLAVLAKPSAVAAPALLLCADWALGRRLAARAKVYAITAGMAAAAVWAATAGHAALGAGPGSHLGWRTLPEAAWALGLHARHLVWPQGLLARYFPPDGAALAAGAAVGAMVAAGLVAGAAWARRRGARAVAFGVVGAAAAYAPASGVIPLSRGPADSYLYLPLAIACVAVARGCEALWRARTRGSARRASAAYAAVAVAGVAAGLALAVTARAQARTWRDAPALWSRVAAAYPDDPRALMRLGDAYLYVRQPDTAIRVYDRIRRRHPAFTASLLAHGDALELAGRPADAERVLCDAARRAPSPPYLEHYAWFLVRTPDISPCDPDAARAALVQIEPLLSARGKRPASLRRAASLLRALGAPAEAARIEARLAAIDRGRHGLHGMHDQRGRRGQ